MGMLDGKVVMITGGANGIGRATAMICSREGAAVAIADIDREAGEVTRKVVEDSGGEAVFMTVDVTDRRDIDAFLDGIVATFGKLDAAFNNAGIEGDMAPVDQCPEDNWYRVLDVDMSSVFHCMQSEIEVMAEHGGSIVNCASVAGLVGFAGAAPYVASKHGIVGLTKAAALDLAQRRIRVNAVCPGVIETDMITRVTHGTAEAVAAFRDMEPVGRLGEPEEVGELVAWLMSDRSSFVTGQAIAVDGGLVAR